MYFRYVFFFDGVKPENNIKRQYIIDSLLKKKILGVV